VVTGKRRAVFAFFLARKFYLRSSNTGFHVRFPILLFIIIVADNMRMMIVLNVIITEQ